MEFAGEIAAGEHGETDSLLLCLNGKLLFESYYRRGRINYPHYQMSITKSYTAMAIGRAIQLGHLSMDDLDKPVVSFLKELSSFSIYGWIDILLFAFSIALFLASGVFSPLRAIPSFSLNLSCIVEATFFGSC